MKTIILNGSPRKNWNTAMMLQEARKGAESVGADTEYIDLFDPLPDAGPASHARGKKLNAANASGRMIFRR